MKVVARLKDKAPNELNIIKTRALRLAALRRISKADADNIVRMVDELAAYIGSMDEKPHHERMFL